MATMDLETKREAYESSQIMRIDRPLGGLMSHNIEYGFVEAIVRGFRTGFLADSDYRALCQCDNFENVKLALADTDYVNALQNELKLTPDIILNKCRDKFINEFNFLKSQAVGQLTTFMDLVTHEYLIKSISFIITSLIKGAEPDTLLAKCHPLGLSPHLKSILTFENFESSDGLVELYRTVLVDTPVAPYFATYFNSKITDVEGKDNASQVIQRVYNEVEIDIITAMLEKMWLEDLYTYCMKLGGDTAEIMKMLLDFEADRRAISIVLNSFGTELNEPAQREGQRMELFCNFGRLYPEATLNTFKRVSDEQSLMTALEPYPEYLNLFKKAQETNRNVADMLAMYEVQLNAMAFDSQSHFAVYYAFVKLKNQELSNLKWILSCINQRRDARDMARYIKIFN